MSIEGKDVNESDLLAVVVIVTGAVVVVVVVIIGFESVLDTRLGRTV